MMDFDSLAPLEADVPLAQQYPAVPRWAIEAYRRVATDLPGVWPSTPDPKRLRYFTWATRQSRNAHEAISIAWSLLQTASVFMGAVSDDLDRFQETGQVPELEEEDFAPQGVNPMLASIGGAALEVSEPQDTPTPTPRLPSHKQERRGMSEKKAAILRLHHAGWDQKSIAAELHSSLSTVGSTIKEARS